MTGVLFDWVWSHTEVALSGLVFGGVLVDDTGLMRLVVIFDKATTRMFREVWVAGQVLYTRTLLQ